MCIAGHQERNSASSARGRRSPGSQRGEGLASCYLAEVLTSIERAKDSEDLDPVVLARCVVLQKKSVVILQEFGNTDDHAVALQKLSSAINDVGMLYENRPEFSESGQSSSLSLASTHYLESLDLALKSKSSVSIIRAYSNLATSYMKRGLLLLRYQKREDAERDKDSEKDRDRDRLIDRQTGRQTGIRTDFQGGKQVRRQACTIVYLNVCK